MKDSHEKNSKTTVYETKLKDLKPIYQGKVRDLFAIDDEHMLSSPATACLLLMWSCPNPYLVKDRS